MASFIKEEEFVYAKFQEDLRSSILEGRIDFSSPIKSESQLCDEYRISRKSIRKALNNLTKEGLVFKIQGKGTFPVPPQKRMHVLAPEKFKITLAIPDFYMTTNEYEEEFIYAIADAAARNGHSLEYSDHNINVGEILKEKTDGVIVVRPTSNNMSVYQELSASGIKLVAINGFVAEAHNIANDTDAELEDTLSLLSLLGHRKTAFLGTIHKNYISLSRKKSYLEAAAGFGIEAPESLYRDAFYENILEVLEDLFRNESPTALIMGGHYLTGGVLNFCRKYKIRLPEDLSLISINDSCIARNFSVPLTVYTEPVQEIGKTAITLLESILNGKPPEEKRIVIKGNLIMRKSCGHPRKGRLKI